MDRVATLTFIVKMCEECPNVKKWVRHGLPVPILGATCKYIGKDIEDWNLVPDWCPLPGVVDIEAKDVVLELEYRKADKNV